MRNSVSAAEAEAVFGDNDTGSENAPVKSNERISSLDFIRGIAVMGILGANIVAFGQPFIAYMVPATFLVPAGDPDGWMWIAQFILIDGKMRGLFSVLFGAGVYLFMERAWARGATRWLQVQRLAWLGLFGLVHFFFIWMGDILFLYSVCGMIALLFIRMKPANKFILGMIGYVIGALAYTAMFGAIYFAATPGADGVPPSAELAEAMAQSEQEQIDDGNVEAELKRSGDYVGLVEHTVAEHWWMPLAFVLQVSIETVPLMLIGMALYQMGFFSGGFDRRKMVLWGWIGVLGGGAATLAIALWNQSDGFGMVGAQMSFIGTSTLPRLAMTLGIAALLVAYSPGWTGWLAERIRAAGRAAFTNYLGTSILMLFVFHGWALGLFGELNRPQLYLVTFLTWCLILLWSKPWLERFRYGPLEWLWRCLTYRKLFPLRR
ncbi:MAG: DUF418 domain-containing protein [Erythrobacter sp.]